MKRAKKTVAVLTKEKRRKIKLKFWNSCKRKLKSIKKMDISIPELFKAGIFPKRAFEKKNS